MAASDMEPMCSFVWSFFSEAIWFTAGFWIFRLCLRCGLLQQVLGWNSTKKAGKSGKSSDSKQRPASAADKTIAFASQAGDHKEVLGAWNQAKEINEPLQVPALQAVCQALIKLQPASLADEIVDYLSKQPYLARSTTLHPLVTTALQAKRPDLALELMDAADASKFQSAVTFQMRDLVLGSFAATAQAKKVKTLLSRRDHDEESWASGGNAAVRGFLKGGHTASGLNQLEETQLRGAELQPATVEALLEAARTSKETMMKIMEALKGAALPLDAAAAAMAHEDVASAETLSGQLPFAVAEPLLKPAIKALNAVVLGQLQKACGQKRTDL